MYEFPSRGRPKWRYLVVRGSTKGGSCSGKGPVINYGEGYKTGRDGGGGVQNRRGESEVPPPTKGERLGRKKS